MKYFPGILLCSALVFFTTCDTYDNAVMYHRDFHPGTNALLNFSGYYSDTLSKGNCKPVFFYANGSALSANNYNGTVPASWNETNASWGNYLITGDSIQLEKFQHIENNFRRIILKGAIGKNAIHWVRKEVFNEPAMKVDYSVYFVPYSPKPDSTQNWIRMKKKYNQ